MLTKKSLFATVSEDPTELGMNLAAAALEHPIYFDEGLGMPVVLRNSEVLAALRDDQTFSNRVFHSPLTKDALLSMDGEAHTRMRKIYNSFFAPQQVRRYEESIVAPAIAEVIDQLAKSTRVDLVDDFCMLVPQRVISALFGLPGERIAENDVLVRAILRALISPFDPRAVAEGVRAHAELASEINAIAERELERPSDTLLGEIAKGLVAEGMGTVQACEGVVFSLILASYETTIWGLASIMSALLRYPDVFARVRENPELLPNAIEESWRWCGSAMGTLRFVERETELAGQTLPGGSVVHLSFVASNFDPHVYPRPETFDIEHKVKSMTFGGGAHFCVGASLARMESRVAVAQLLKRFPGLRADSDRKAPVFAPGTRGAASFGPDHLPAVLA
jgi:cytochrome P450